MLLSACTIYRITEWVRQAGVQLSLDDLTQAHLMHAWEDKAIPPNIPLFLLSMQCMMPYGLEYPFGHLGSAVLAVSTPSSLCTSRPLLVGWGEEQKSLGSVGALCISNENVLGLSTLFPA